MATKTLLVGTTNAAKVSIVRAALEGLAVEVVTPDEVGVRVEVKEDGQSTQENASKKARAYCAAAGLPVLAIDGGLRIEGLAEEKQPGALVRRIGDGEREATDEEVLEHYARELEGIGGETTGRWQGSMALAVPHGRLYARTVTFETRMTARRKGGVRPGAPLDALTIDPATGRYYSEMEWQERPDVEWVLEFVQEHLAELG